MDDTMEKLKPNDSLPVGKKVYVEKHGWGTVVEVNQVKDQNGAPIMSHSIRLEFDKKVIKPNYSYIFFKDN